MLYIFIGQSCTGKSTAANRLQELTGAEIFTGKDYLRMGSNENAAWHHFTDRLASAAGSKDASKSIIYIITERDDLSRLNTLDDAIRVKFTASIDTIRSRFAQRLNGHLPLPVERMLERQFEAWKDVEADLYVDTTEERSADEIARTVLDFSSSASK